MCDRCVDASGHCIDDRCNVVAVNRLAFSSQRGELFVRERFPSRVREESVDDAGDVPDMKRRRRHICRPRVPLIVGQSLDQFANALVDL